MLAHDAPLIVGDALRLRQVLLNLLSNAIKFTQNGFVRFDVTSVIRENIIRIVFIVQDSGIGMSTQQISQLFEKFTQADTSTTREYGGTGLGLAITGKFVELMGGKIEVRSQLGQGSCFTVEIPFAVALVGDKYSEAAEAGRNASGNGSSMVDVTWLNTFADHLRKGDFAAKNLWENNKHILGHCFTPAEFEQINRALQQFDYALALECLATRDVQ